VSVAASIAEVLGPLCANFDFVRPETVHRNERDHERQLELELTPIASFAVGQGSQ
jgi:hypothetical protein